jgi:hypothetical protein
VAQAFGHAKMMEIVLHKKFAIGEKVCVCRSVTKMGIVWVENAVMQV